MSDVATDISVPTMLQPTPLIGRVKHALDRDFPLVVAGIIAATLGLLPWLITGMELPLQNLWRYHALPGEMPLALLPIHQYYLPTLFAIIVLPGALLGVFLRWRLRATTGLSVGMALFGYLSVMLLAAFQALIVTGLGLLYTSRYIGYSAIYLSLMVGAVFLFTALGALLCRMIARGRAGTAVIGVAFGGLALSYWIWAFLYLNSALFFGATGLYAIITQANRFLPAVIVGFALAWCGWHTLSRLAAWVGAVITVWAGHAVITAFMAAIGYRVYYADPARLIEIFNTEFNRVLHTETISLVIPVLIGISARMLFQLYRKYRAQYQLRAVL